MFVCKLFILVREVAKQMPGLVEVEWKKIHGKSDLVVEPLFVREDNTTKTDPPRALKYAKYLEHQAKNGGFNTHVRDLLFGAAYEITRLYRDIESK